MQQGFGIVLKLAWIVCPLNLPVRCYETCAISSLLPELLQYIGPLFDILLHKHVCARAKLISSLLNFLSPLLPYLHRIAKSHNRMLRIDNTSYIIVARAHSYRA